MHLLVSTACGNVVILTEGLLHQNVTVALFPKERGVRIDLAIDADQVGAAHRRRRVAAGACGRVGCSRHFVSHPVSECVLLEIGLTSDIVEKVGAGECPGISIGMVRVGVVGVRDSIGTYARKSCTVDTITIGVIDAPPSELIIVGCFGDFSRIVRADHVVTNPALEGNLGLAGLTGLGGDEDDTVSSTGTVKSG